MSRINKEIAAFIVSLILIVLAGLFVKMPNYMPTLYSEPQVGAIAIQFKEGITEPEVKAILENYNMTMYQMKYNVDSFGEKYYILVDKDKMTDVRDELKKEENWTDASYIKKGNYYVFTVSELVISDEHFLKILNKYDLQLKKFVCCEILFTNGSKNWISQGSAIGIKRELEMNENIFSVFLEYRR